MGQNQEPNPRLYEDETFEYGGYAKVTPADLVIGDGIRWPDGDGCWLIVDVVIDADFGLADLTLVDRSSHVTTVLAEAGIVKADELASALIDSTFTRVVGVDEPVWVRL